MYSKDYLKIKHFLCKTFGNDRIEGPECDIKKSETKYAVNLNGVRHILGFSLEFMEDNSELEIIGTIQDIIPSLSAEKVRVYYLIKNSGIKRTEF